MKNVVNEDAPCAGVAHIVDCDTIYNSALMSTTREGSSPYHKIKEACLRNNQPWNDTDFPTTQNSLFYHQIPSIRFKWLRCHAIRQDLQFWSDESAYLDVTRGLCGQKWLLSCLKIIHLSKGLLFRVVDRDQTIGPAGVLRFTLWWLGRWVDVLIDDYLPTSGRTLVFLQPKSTNQLWSSLLEKALAKLFGSYEALKYGSTVDGLTYLTGGVPEKISINEVNMRLIKNLLRSQSIVTASLTKAVRNLKAEANYRVDKIVQVNSGTGPLMLIKLSISLSPGEEMPPYVAVGTDKQWQSIGAEATDGLELPANATWILLKDFIETFECLDVVHLYGEIPGEPDPYFANKQPWLATETTGRWQNGVSAGGCRNHPTFHYNPHYQITINETDTVVFCLSQIAIFELKVIGFTIYKVSERLSEPCSEEKFKEMSSFATSKYSNCQHVTVRCKLDPASYLLIPTTYEPGKENDFIIRILSMKSLTVEFLDYKPALLRNIFLTTARNVDEGHNISLLEAGFLRVADEHKTVNAFELQELMDAFLPNNFMKSCTTIETCRQIILTFDEKGSGRINVSHFKDLLWGLRQWQRIFKSHAWDRTPVMKDVSLRDALREAGFSIPGKVLYKLLIKYMRKDSYLRFCDFIGVILVLYKAFTTYHENSASLGITLEHWLENTLTF